jgi:hypothetical protein
LSGRTSEGLGRLLPEDLIDVLTEENDKSEKVTIENPILSNIDDEFPTIDIISP